MMIGKDDFKRATGVSEALALRWSMVVSLAAAEFDIVTPARLAMWLATIGHESAGFVHTREIWGPTAAQARYKDRADLGNTRPEAIAIAATHGSDPGAWWRGYGLIQTTGFDNHKETGLALGLDLLNQPSLLMEPENAARSGGYFWKSRNLNAIADSGNFLLTQTRVNGKNKDGLPNGWNDRQIRYRLAANVLGAE